MQILFVTPGLDYGGAARQLTLIAGGLPRDRFQPRVCVLGRDAPWAEGLRAAGVVAVREAGADRCRRLGVRGERLAVVAPGVPAAPLTPNPSPPRGEGGKQNSPLPSGERGGGEEVLAGRLLFGAGPIEPHKGF